MEKEGRDGKKGKSGRAMECVGESEIEGGMLRKGGRGEGCLREMEWLMEGGREGREARKKLCKKDRGACERRSVSNRLLLLGIRLVLGS